MTLEREAIPGRGDAPRRAGEEVRRTLEGFREEGGDLVADFTFSPEFVGFDGHFPGNKVLPGVCQIQCVKAVLERWKEEEVRIGEIVSAKFTAPVGPGETVECRVSGVAASGEGYSLKARLSKGGVRVSELKLRVSFNGATPERG